MLRSAANSRARFRILDAGVRHLSRGGSAERSARAGDLRATPSRSRSGRELAADPVMNAHLGPAQPAEPALRFVGTGAVFELELAAASGQ